MIEDIVNSSPYPCESYHEISDTLLYSYGARKDLECHHADGVGITTVVSGTMGFASTSNVENVKEAYELSKKFARYGSRRRDLPLPSSPAAVQSCFDPRIAKADPDDVVDLAEEILQNVPPSCKVVDETLLLKMQEIHITNSNGVNVSRKSTLAVLDITLNHEILNSSFYSCFYTRMWDMNWHLSEEIDRWIENSQHKCDIEAGEIQVIFSPLALSRILDAVFVPAFSGGLPEVYERLSVADKSMASKIDIYDHGTLKGGRGTEPFDGEGVPQQVTPLVEKGYFVSGIYDTTSAKVLGKGSTGNAVRESFEDIPEVYITNLFIPPVVKTEELISETKNGIYIGDLFGAYIANPPSGTFTSTISRSYRIQKGEIRGILPPKTVEGDIFSLLKNLMPGDDIKKIDHYVVPSSKTTAKIY
ncbi:MAG: hypothetical protein AYK18_15075 [Theionarchaea archaeon DG-70]|nr:MAG: hypothetical protein AYK18_15075 [Theionarchaea archaeon DG-70]